MKSLSALMLIGMLFAINAVNAKSDITKQCNKVADQCKDKRYDRKLIIWRCKCQAWSERGHGCPPGRPAHGIRRSHQRQKSTADLSPRSGDVGSGHNKAFEFGDALGIFRGDSKGFYKGCGHGCFGNDDKKGYTKGANDHGNGQDSRHKEAGLKKFKKENKQGSGKDEFGFREELDFGNDFGASRGSFEGDRYSGFEGNVGSFSGSSSTSGFRGGNFFGARSFDGGKGDSGSRHEKEKIEKITAHLKKEKKHKAAAQVNADAKFKAAAAHETFHRNALLAKKIAAEKNMGGYSWFF